MREKKYANILDDYPEEIEEKIKESLEEMSNSQDNDSEEKLSMTRELKFKELQDTIDSSDKEIEVEEALDLNATDEVEIPVGRRVDKVKSGIYDELTEEKQKKELIKEEKKVSIKKETKKDETDSFSAVTDDATLDNAEYGKNNDDIYLTSSFKPFRKRFKLKKVFKVLFILILIAAIIFSVTYFLIIPLYNKYQASKPKAIFDASLQYVGEQAGKVIDLSWNDSDIIDFDMLMDFDSNIKDTEVLNAGTIGTRILIDPKQEQLEASLFVQDKDKNRYGFSVIDDNKNLYYKMSTSDTYIKADRENEKIDFSGIEEYFSSNLEPEDLKYYINTNIEILKEIITADMLTSEKDEIEINGKTISVIKNSLELDKDKLEKLNKEFNEKVLEDDKLLEIEATLNDMTVSEVKESYEKTEDYKDTETLVINIYTIKGDKFVGLDIEENGFRNIYYYSHEGNFKAHLNLTEDEDCLEGRDCLLENKMVIDLIGTKQDGYTKVEIMYNDEDIGTLKVRSFNLESIDFTYKVIISDVVFEGVIKLDIDKENEEYKLKFSLEFNEEYVDMDMTIKIHLDSKISDINSANVVNYSDLIFENEYKKLEDKLKEAGLLETFELLLISLEDSSQNTENNFIENGFSGVTA